jgi:Putative transmembrane protein (Alph_Pro_TM).
MCFVSAAALIVSLCCTTTAQADDAIELTIKPANIDISASYRGTVLHVEGLAPKDSEIVARFTGAPADLTLRQKGKVFNLLWMNLGTVHLQHVPSVFLVTSSQPLASIHGNELGLAAVHNGIKVQEHKADNLDLAAELIKLKQQDGLYRETTGGIIMAENGSFSADLRIPSQLSPGTYAVEIFALHDGSIVGSVSTPVSVKLVGMPAWIDDMARNSSLLYGILSTLVAIFGGLAIGLICQSKGGAH